MENKSSNIRIRRPFPESNAPPSLLPSSSMHRLGWSVQQGIQIYREDGLDYLWQIWVAYAGKHMTCKDNTACIQAVLFFCA